VLGRVDVVEHRARDRTPERTDVLAHAGAQLGRLGRILAQAYGKEVQLNFTVDPAVIGGLHIKVGDDVVDATVLSRMTDARRRMAS